MSYLVYVDKLNRADSGGGAGKFTIHDALVHLPTPADLLAAVREGVESGTIEGEVDVDWRLIDLKLPHGTYIVIGPVSDGGEDAE